MSERIDLPQLPPADPGVYGQKLAEDPWFQARDCRVIPLPTGQGLVIQR